MKRHTAREWTVVAFEDRSRRPSGATAMASASFGTFRGKLR